MFNYLTSRDRGKDEVSCDQCGQVEFFSTSDAKARRQMKKAGWIIVEAPAYHHNVFCSSRCESAFFARHPAKDKRYSLRQEVRA